MHMVVMAAILGVIYTIVIEISYSETFTINVVYFIVGLKLIQIILDVVLNKVMGETLLVSPMLTTFELVLFLVTLGAKSFTNFLVAYALELVLIILERLFFDPMIKRISTKMPELYAKFQRMQRRQRGLRTKVNRLTNRIHELQDRYAASANERMLNSLVVFANETVAILLMPVLVILVYMFYDQTQVGVKYGDCCLLLLLLLLLSVALLSNLTI
jgi:hypothetical protein